MINAPRARIRITRKRDGKRDIIRELDREEFRRRWRNSGVKVKERRRKQVEKLRNKRDSLGNRSKLNTMEVILGARELIRIGGRLAWIKFRIRASPILAN